MKNANFYQKRNGTKEKSYVVVKVGIDGQALNEQINEFLLDFLDQLETTGHKIAQKPIREFSADDEKHALNLISAIKNLNMDFLLVFFFDKQYMGIKNKIRRINPNLKVFTIETTFLSTFQNNRIGYGKLANFCQSFASIILNESSSQQPGPSQSLNKQQLNGTAISNKSKYPIGIADVEKICTNLVSRQLLPGSSDLLREIMKPAYFDRCNDLWQEPEKQSKFLQILVATASSVQSDLLTLTHDFLKKVLDSKLIEFLVDQHVFQVMIDPRKRTPIYAVLFDYLVALIVKGLEMLPSSMNLKHVHSVLTTLNGEKVQSYNFLKEETNRNLERMKALLENQMESKSAELTKQSVQSSSNVATFQGSRGAPPENFRELSVMPTVDDIIHTLQVFLRPALKTGKYEDSEHYLDVQFRLMREDLLRPLRDGIEHYRKGGIKETDLFVYRNIKVEPPVLHKQSGELMTVAKLQIRKRMRWNKRLKFGSLVCLSADDFRNHFIFATVLDRDDLQSGVVGLKFENPQVANSKQEYCMVESPAFFECYKYVMMALQSIPENGEVPFSKYIVQILTRTQNPQYLRRAALQLNFEVLMKYPTNLKMVNVTHLSTMLTPRDFGMDRSQFEALHYALTTDLAVIQGPPGTGKTYIGLQIARLLFANEHVWNSHSQTPMLVVCYTNHALDQFLEGMLKFLKTGIVRIGGRCKNPALENCTLLKVRQNGGKSSNQIVYRQLVQERFKLKDIAAELSYVNKSLKELRSGLTNPKFLKNSMKEHNGDFLLHNLDERPHSFFHWLTYGKRKEVYVPEIKTIRQLTTKGYTETAIKNAIHELQTMEAKVLIGFLKENKQNPKIFGRLNDQIKFWPKIHDIDQLKRLKINEEVAIQMLLSADGNIRKVEETLGRFQAIARKLTVEDVTVENFIDEDFGLYRDDDDDRDRMNFDFQEFWEETNNFGKNKDSVQNNNDSWFTDSRMKSFAKHIASAPAMTEGEANAIKDLWSLSLQDRWRLYQFWIKVEKRNVKQTVKMLEKEYNESIRRLAELRALNDLDILKNSKVIGMTTTGAAMHQASLRALKPKIVIIEEAAEVLEAHVLISLTTACEHVILIGDHKQLRPNPSVYELAKRYNLEISLFERLINNNYPYKCLENQHRMRPEISRTLMPHFYPNLKDDVSVQNYPNIKGVSSNMIFITHNNPEINDPELKSHSNPFEAEYAVRLAKYLRQQSYKDEEITILCTYLEQLIEIRKLAQRLLGEKHGVRIENVDNYQGEECEIIILSLVRSNNPHNKIGFLNIDNRVCVALSRAKHGLYVIANMEFLAERCDLWKNIKKYVEAIGALKAALPVKCQIHGEKQEIGHYSEFETKCKEGGCQRACNIRLDCGHTCTKPCHSYDKNHKEIPCTKPCARTCSLGHPCKKNCFQPCGECYIKVNKHLPCGHTKLDSCHLLPAKVKCIAKCMKKLRCGHPCENICSEACTTFCKVEVRRQLTCGHLATVCCSSNLATFKCKTLVEKEFPVCKHRVEVECYVDVNVAECLHPCNIPISDCGHLCKGTCGACRNGRLHIRCQENCNRILVCGHECKSKCSRVCPPCTRSCETACTHSQCGSVAYLNEDKKKVRDGEVLASSKQRKRKNGRLCGDPCPPCAEKCENECEHRKCSNSCYQPCNVGLCMEPCRKKLDCSPKDENADPHYCIGVCGEDCPQICKFCNKEKFEEIREILFGNEDEENARFLQLKDCGHIFEVSGLDKYVSDTITSSSEELSDVAIVQIACPLCKTPIRRSKRYVSILNQRLIDMEMIKAKIKGKNEGEFKKDLDACIQKANEQLNKFQLTAFTARTEEENFLIKYPAQLVQRLKSISSKDFNQDLLDICGNVLKIMDRFHDIYKEIKTKKYLFLVTSYIGSSPKLWQIMGEYKITDFYTYLLSELNALMKIVTSNEIQYLSEVMLQQLVKEIERLEFLLFIWMAKFFINRRDIDLLTERPTSTLRSVFNFVSSPKITNSANGNKLRTILNLLNQPFEDENRSTLTRNFITVFLDRIKTLFNEVVQSTPFSGLAITEKERLEIDAAVGYSQSNPHGVNKWYKCPNGHIYGIGDCGMAMVKSRCLECNAEIGGQNHSLHATNRVAEEMMRGVRRPIQNPFVALW